MARKFNAEVLPLKLSCDIVTGFMNKILLVIIFAFLLVPVGRGGEPTFADLSVFCAKGYFKAHLESRSSVEEYVYFLNARGVCISLFDLMDPDVGVEKEDVARVIGQSTLLFMGEGQLQGDCIELPKEMRSWVDYCVLNDVPLAHIYLRFIRAVESGSFPEVKSFFANG